jgi:DNA-binding beta-propeller fold protein YncE
LLLLLGLAACGSRGAVNFTIRAPAVTELNPFADARLSEYLLKSADGHVLAAASPGSSDGPLALGPLPASDAPIDVEMSVLGGTDLLGMARIRNVAIKPGVENTYFADVRKPFVFVGSALPDEFDQMNHVQSSQVIDPATAMDVAAQLAGDMPPVKLPQAVGAATATSDGRFLLLGHARVNAGATPGLTVVDTGSAQQVGELPLGFAPWRVVAAPRDAAVALLDPTPPSGNLLIINDVAGLISQPGAAQPLTIALQGDTPRNAVFAADGSQLYVLDGNSADLDPCGAQPAPGANSVWRFDAQGNAMGQWKLPAFAADLALDESSGQILVSFPLMGAVGSIDASTPAGAVSPRMLLTNSTCPSALHATGGELYVITGEPGGTPAEPTFRLKRIPIAGGNPDNFDFPQPQYQAQVNESDSRDGKVAFNLTVRPKFFHAYDLAVAPDASRVAFATRTHYSEASDQNFMLVAGFDCAPTMEIIEYGFYALDTRTGAASYQMRSQIVTSPGATSPCITCTNPPFFLTFGCPTVPGDRPAGVAAVFGTP